MVHRLIPRPSFIDGNCEFLKMIGEHKLWRSLDGKRLYTWDNQHGELEVFTKRGIHLGSADAITGKFIKPAVKGRRLDV